MYSADNAETIETLKRAMAGIISSVDSMRGHHGIVAEIAPDLKETFVRKLKANMLSICESDISVSLVEEAAREASTSANNSPEVFDEILKRKNKNRKPANEHPMYLKLLEHLKASEEALDEDFVVRDEGPVIKCPISKKVMKVPMKNKICGHKYDQESIEGLLKMARKVLRCPVPGCTNKVIRKNDLEVDDHLKNYIERHTSKEQDQVPESSKS